MDTSSIGHHISGQFNKEIEDIHNHVLTMGGMVEEQLELALQAFVSGNLDEADRVIKQENQIDVLEVALDKECTQIMALRQPTAFDLRLLITVLRIINELERVGDLAEHIAKMTINLADMEGHKSGSFHEINHMAELVRGMLHDALDSFARMSVDQVHSIISRNENVDREYGSVVRQQITYMMEDPRNITRTFNVLWAVRSLERIGDHACNICEHLVYMVKGEDVRHVSREELERKLKGE